MEGPGPEPAVTEQLPVSVIIPTVGRTELLRECLDTLAGCDPRAAELVVVDQSHKDEVRAIADRFASLGARLVICEERGAGVGLNVGLREASHEVVLLTHDDCTVPPSWVRTAWDLVSGSDGIVTGKVLPAGDDPLAVASIKENPTPCDYTGEVQCGVFFPNNAVGRRSELLELGGFDERFGTNAAMDNDFCYRWLRSGRSLRYEPALVVWHHDWRSHEALERLYVRYWHGQGLFYAKHLRLGDLTPFRFLVGDLRRAARAMAVRVIRGRPRWSDSRRGVLLGLPRGLVDGWRRFKPGTSAGSSLEWS
jgi:GT2 family glycosyltransferase